MTDYKQEAKQLLQNLTTSNAVPYWFECKKQLLQLIINNDINSFLNWKPIRDTMYAVNTSYSETEYNSLKNTKFINYINENTVGSPTYSRFNYSTSDNLVHMIYHLKEYEQKTNSNIEDYKTVLEFGGGYGCLSNVFNKINKNCKYVIFDFPEFNLLQKYYLSSNGNKILSSLDEFLTSDSGIYLTSNLDDIFTIKRFDLLIGTWSLSESPIDFRNHFLSNVECKNYLLAYQKHFDDSDGFLNINNENYFNGMKLSDMTWIDYKINHLYGEQFYQFGTSSK